jgi:hypothetical protein
VSDELSCAVMPFTKPFAARSPVMGTPIEGAADDRIIDSTCVPPTGILSVGGLIVIVAVTITCWLAAR